MIAKTHFITLACLALAGSACSSSEPGGDGGDAGGPKFLSFGTNVTTLAQTSTTMGPDSHDSVTFVAVVTHPQGVSDLVGGHLTDAAGTIQFGAFIASQQGSYELTLTWDQIYQATHFQFTGQQQMSFVAQFFDAQGRDATNTTTLTLACAGGAGWGTCDSVCKDLQNDAANCGACGGTCASVHSSTCKQALCTYAKFFDPTFSQSCTQVCAAHGGTCTDSSVVGSYSGYADYQCNDGSSQAVYAKCGDVPSMTYMGCQAVTVFGGYECICDTAPP